MGSTALNLELLRQEVPSGVEIVAVSKFKPMEMIREAYNAGQRLFGESRVQELIPKIEELPDDIEWHFIGHLQTNKVKYIIGKTSLIESVDSERLLEVIDNESRKEGVITKVLLQAHIASEETKFGFSLEELKEYFIGRKFEKLTNTHISGLMGMASLTEDSGKVRREFASLADMMRKIKTEICPDLRDFDELSMGMSGDWPIAVEEGATMIRVGSSIFGDR